MRRSLPEALPRDLRGITRSFQLSTDEEPESQQGGVVLGDSPRERDLVSGPDPIDDIRASGR